MRDERVDVVAHVGSSSTGAWIAATCGARMAKAVVENGGKDAIVVDAGVDPEWAAEQVAVGAFTNAGQLCTAVERVYVHEAVAQDVLDALVRRAAALRAGDPRDPGPPSVPSSTSASCASSRSTSRTRWTGAPGACTAAAGSTSTGRGSLRRSSPTARTRCSS